MKIQRFTQKNAKIIQLTVWIVTGLNSLYACILIFLMGLWVPRLWLIAIPWILIVFILLFWELISGIILSIGGIGGIIWHSFASLNSWYLPIAFIIPIITGVLLILAWVLEKRITQ